MSSATLGRATRVTKRRMRPRSELKRELVNVLRAKFPHDTIDISDGFEGSIHVLVVSRVFDKLAERGRYSYLWKIIQRAGFSEPENDSITVVVGVSPRELI